ncbi:trypsin-like peptidase domain-containing protein [Kitasatospora sp. NPDC058444]|uniref:trypsin-like peptidase domain-containing protein n=1 Tax=Kitasatospora sp. NPDC058444 TaxID=3346504 RepID=UPI0036651405
MLDPDTVDGVLMRCLVRLTAPGAPGGTGFFVAPGRVLTCAHVVAAAQSPEVRVAHLDGEFTGRIAALHPPERGSGALYPFPDLAVIEVAIPGAECVLLDQELPGLEDRLHCLGFTGIFSGQPPTAEPATFTFEGTHDTGDGQLLKLGAGSHASPGMSGAPLMNLRTHRVCGVVKTTRSAASPSGGWAIPAGALSAELAAANARHHARSGNWASLLPAHGPGRWSSATDQALPARLRRLLASAPAHLTAVDAMFRSHANTPSVLGRCRRLMDLATAMAAPEALQGLSARDAVVLTAVALAVARCEELPVDELAAAIAGDRPLQATWSTYVHAVESMSPRLWQEQAGCEQEPDPRALEALAADLGEAEQRAVELFCEAHGHLLAAAAGTTGTAPPLPDNEPFVGCGEVVSVLLRTLTDPPDTFAERCIELLGGARFVAGCRVLYLGSLLRVALWMRPLMEVSADETLTPVRTSSTADHWQRRLQRQVDDIRLESEEGAEALRIVCSPDNPRLLEGLRTAVIELRQVVNQCSAVLARNYPVGREAVFRLRFPVVRSNIDDSSRYVRESGLAFEPELGRLTLNASGVLPLLVRPLYGHRPEVGVRELLQNALDAVWARQAIQAGRAGPNAEPVDHRIVMAITDRSGLGTALLDDGNTPPEDWDQWMEVRDTGVGMTAEVVRQNFLTVGGTWDPTADPAVAELRNRPRRLRIGRFGVGVMAAFLLGSEIQVITRHMAAAEDEGVCFRFVEHDDTTEIYRCRAPVGTTVRIRLDQRTAENLLEDPDAWDWFRNTDPPVVRGVVRNGAFLPIASQLTRLTPGSHWRRLRLPPYGEVLWTPSPESFKSHIFLNGVRVVSLHRNFDKNVMAPIEQLKQPVIDIADQNSAAAIRLTRDGFISYPDDVFQAVRRDAVADHLAWLALVAEQGRDARIPWESRLWEDEQYHWGQGDGVVRAAPFVVCESGIVPLHPVLLHRAGITEVDLLLSRGGLTGAGEASGSGEELRTTPTELMKVLPLRPGRAVGLLKVDMFGGFGYHPFAAGASEAFRYASAALNASASVQLVTADRGDAYGRMNDGAEVRRWGDVLLLRDSSRISISSTSDRERRQKERALRKRYQRASEQLEAYIAALESRGPDGVRAVFKRVLATRGYGVLHAWLEAPENRPDDDLAELWQDYRFPPVLPFAAPERLFVSPRAADLRMRMERVAREESGAAPDGPVPGEAISTPNWGRFRR